MKSFHYVVHGMIPLHYVAFHTCIYDLYYYQTRIINKKDFDDAKKLIYHTEIAWNSNLEDVFFSSISQFVSRTTDCKLTYKN